MRLAAIHSQPILSGARHSKRAHERRQRFASVQITVHKYHKVVGEATTRTESLLELRPLSRRKRERAPAPAPRRRHARAEPLQKRARTESDANAAMLLLSCMRREDSLPAPIAA